MAKRIAVIGGDERSSRVAWPKKYEAVCYQSTKYGGNGPLRGLENALAQDKFDAVILLVRWMGHATFNAVRGAASCPVITWERGIGTLAKNLDDVLAGKNS